MAVGSKELAPAQLDGFDNERLVEELRKAKEELFNLRFQSATGQLENHGRLRAVKRTSPASTPCCVSASWAFVPRLPRRLWKPRKRRSPKKADKAKKA